MCNEVAPWFYSLVVSFFLLSLPNIQAANAPAIVIEIVLKNRSTKTLACEKKFDEACNPKLTEPQKRNPVINAYFKPAANVLAHDHFIIMVIRNPIINEVATIAHTIS